MNKAIVLPSQRLVVSGIPWGSVGGHSGNITPLNADAGLRVLKSDLLPLARALIEIYEGIVEEEERRQARRMDEPAKKALKGC